MKHIFLSIIAFFLSCNQTLKFTSIVAQKISVLISISPETMKSFGIRSKFIKKELVENLNLKDTTKLSYDQAQLVIFPAKQQILTFVYQEGSYKVQGQLFLPNFDEVKYSFVYSAETMLPVEIKPYYYKNPIRYGTWIYENEGVIEQEDYDIKINYKFLKH